MIKVFIQNDQWGEFLKEDLEEIAKREELELKITAPKGGYRRLPTGFDVYIPYLSEISNNDIIELREEQKQSLIYALIGGISGYIPDSLKEANDPNRTFDKFY